MLRVLGKRNQIRLEALKEAAVEQEEKEADASKAQQP